MKINWNQNKSLSQAVDTEMVVEQQTLRIKSYTLKNGCKV